GDSFKEYANGCHEHICVARKATNRRSQCAFNTDSTRRATDCVLYRTQWPIFHAKKQACRGYQRMGGGARYSFRWETDYVFAPRDAQRRGQPNLYVLARERLATFLCFQ